MNNSIKEIGGKFYKKYKIVMLPTEKASKIAITFGELAYATKGQFVSDENTKPQHLYILSDEEIKEGDWFAYSQLNYVPLQCKNINKLAGVEKKIIATTDLELNLPSLSNAFLKAYCEKGGIDEVLVEYELIQTTLKENYQYSNGQSNLNYEYRLKVSPDNTITIKPVKEKLRNRVELIDVINSAFGDLAGGLGYSQEQLDKWIEENI